MQTRPIDEHADGRHELRPPTDDGWMGSAYVGVIVVEVLVLVGLWAIGAYFSSL